MLDIVKMNQNSTLPNALRQQWKFNTGRDPLKSVWGVRATFLLAFLFALFLPSCMIWYGVNILDLRWVVLISILSASLSAFCIILCRRCNKLVQEFTDAIELLCREREEGNESVLPFIDPLDLMYYNVDQLRQRAELKLRIVIGKILDFENTGEESHSQVIRTEELTPLHQAMNNLGLADPVWNRYFRVERKARVVREETEEIPVLH